MNREDLLVNFFIFATVTASIAIGFGCFAFVNFLTVLPSIIWQLTLAVCVVLITVTGCTIAVKKLGKPDIVYLDRPRSDIIDITPRAIVPRAKSKLSKWR